MCQVDYDDFTGPPLSKNQGIAQPVPVIAFDVCLFSRACYQKEPVFVNLILTLFKYTNDLYYEWNLTFRKFLVIQIYHKQLPERILSKEKSKVAASHKNTGGWFWRKDSKVRHYLDRVQPPDSLVLVITSLIVGVGTGLGAVVFVWMLEQISSWALWMQLQFGNVGGLLIGMALSGLLVGYIVNRWASEAKGHGVPEVMEAVALRNGRIRPRVAAIKVLASSLTIGAGGSAGREGPIVQVGSALGSTVGQIFHFSGERVQTLVACGAAAGIAATFNAPIAGALFALEVILGKFTVRYFGAVVISSVAAGIVGRAYLSDQPAFIVPAYPFQPGEIPIYSVLGILAALVAVLFVRVLYRAEFLFDNWTLHPALKAALGMALTALVALPLTGYSVLGPGLEFIGEAIADDFSLPLGLMAALLVLKLLATVFTLGAGNSGGVFAPSLFMGAILGGMVGSVAHSIWPDVAINPGAYAIVGMAAVFSGAARAPITAVLIVFEMSNDYKLILPLMLATVLSTLLAEILFKESIYTLKLKLRGINWARGRDQDLLQSVMVGDVMTKDPYVVEVGLSVSKLGHFLQKTHHHSFPVLDGNGRLTGMVSLTDYERAVDSPHFASLVVGDIATMGPLLTVYDDEPLSEAVQRLALRSVNKLPVVPRENPEQVIGVIRREDVVKAYNLARARRAESEEAVSFVPMKPTDQQMRMITLALHEGCPAFDKRIVDVGRKLPYESIIVSIQRQGALLIPHGDTVLKGGDRLNVLVRGMDEAHLRRCLVGEER